MKIKVWKIGVKVQCLLWIVPGMFGWCQVLYVCMRRGERFDEGEGKEET